MTDRNVIFNERYLRLVIFIIILLSLGGLYFATKDYHKRQPELPEIFINHSVRHKLFIDVLDNYRDERNKQFNIQFKNMQQVSQQDAEKSLLICFILPDDSIENIIEFKHTIGGGNHLLVILPKWEVPLTDSSGKKLKLIDIKKVDSILNVLLPEKMYEVQREKDISYFPCLASKIKLLLPQVLQMDTGSFEPLFCADDKNIFGKYHGNDDTISILTDPDLFSNYGLTHRGNAFETFKVIASLIPDESNSIIIVDKFIQASQSPNLLLMIFQYPQNLLLCLLILITATLVWGGLKKRMQYSDLALNHSNRKEHLLRAFSSYFEYSKVSNLWLANKYYKVKLRQVAKKLYAPESLSEKELRNWLHKFFNSRKGNASYDNILKQIQTRGTALSKIELLTIAEEIYSINKKLSNYETGRSRKDN